MYTPKMFVKVSLCGIILPARFTRVLLPAATVFNDDMPVQSPFLEISDPAYTTNVIPLSLPCVFPHHVLPQPRIHGKRQPAVRALEVPLGGVF